MSVYSKFLELKNGVPRTVDLSNSSNILGLAELELLGSISGSVAHLAAATTTPYSLYWPSVQGSALTFLQNDGSGNLSWTAVTSSPAISNVLVAGQSFSGNTSYVVRWGMNALSETADRVYAADYDTSSYDEFWLIGIAFSSTSVSAGNSITVYTLGSYTLASGDAPFSTSDIGNPLWLTSSGAFSTTAPSGSTEADSKVGIVMSTSQIWLDGQMLGVGGASSGAGPVPLPVSEGGTGVSLFSPYAVIAGGITDTGALQQVSGLGSSGYILTSNGASALPSWQANSASAGGSSGSLQYNNGSNGFAGSSASSDGNNVSVDDTYAFRLNGISDANWAMGRNLSNFTSPWLSSQISSNVFDLVCGDASGEGFVFGNNSGTQYLNLDSNANAWFGNDVNAVGTIAASNFSGSSSGTNTGDQTITLTGDVTGSGTGSFAATLATVNSNTGSFGSSTSIPSFTVNGKGLITAASGNAVIAPAGTLSGSTLSSGVTASSLTSLGTQAQALNMGSNKINNVTDGSSAGDAVNYGQLQAAISGLYWQGPAQAYSNSNVPLTGASSLTIDGYSVQNGDLVILGNQTIASQNGEYTASGIGSAYVLTANGLPSAAGDAWLILNGTVYADSAFVANAAVPSATFTEFAGPTAYTFSAPLGLSGRTVSITEASGSSNGYLNSTDWNTFNGKQAAGNYITALTGDATASGPGSAALTLSTVNTNTGSFGSSTSIPTFTVNGKGLITAASGNVVVAPAGTLSGTTLNSTVVSSSLTSVGTIATGVWEGSVVASTYVGLGRTINAQSGTTYTFALADGSAAGGNPLVTFGSASATTVTVPTNASVAFPVGTQIDCIQQGAGAVTFSPAIGVTLNSNGGLVIGAQYVGVSLIQTAANTWTIIGYLT